MVETAVLFVTFARPEYARQTFDAIKKAQPKKLYFYSNKAREDKPDEVKRNNKVRAFVDEIDWDCELITWFRDDYVDVYESTWGAYDWVFDNEEQAICLEEDCVPSLSFFDYCDQLLPIYKDEQRVWLLSGNNLVKNIKGIDDDYFFTYFPYMYGWASWRESWQSINRESLPIEEMIRCEIFDDLYIYSKAATQAYKFIRRNKDTRSWDVRFTLSMKMRNAMAIVPKINLVTNIGINGANSKGISFLHKKLQIKDDSDSYLIQKHPLLVVRNRVYDKKYLRTVYLRRKNLLFKVYFKIKQLL